MLFVLLFMLVCCDTIVEDVKMVNKELHVW